MPGPVGTFSQVVALSLAAGISFAPMNAAGRAVIAAPTTAPAEPPPPSPSPVPAPTEPPAPAPAPTEAPGPAPAPTAAPPPTAAPGAPVADAPASTPAAEPPDALAVDEDPATSPAPATVVAPSYDGDPGEARAPAEEPPSKGLGYLITGGALLVGMGIPLTGYGGFYYARARRSPSIFSGLDQLAGTVMLSFGIAGLAAGGALLTVGGIKLSRYRAWQREHQVSLRPSMGRTALGTHTAGLHLRF